jgi:wyosine [tRNA(Phe)-imidazoG37] synthetase (radical SAM superfamily)
MSSEIFRGAKSKGLRTDNSISSAPCFTREAAFGFPRNFLSNRFVYAVFSSRAGGLSVGINMLPHKVCNFNCVYCEVNREEPGEGPLEVTQMAGELRSLLGFILNGELSRHPQYSQLPKDLLELRQVALSGDGEPTLAPNFKEAVEAVIHVRATGQPPPFKLVLITNGSGLDLPHVQAALNCFLASDEIWIKLDGGSPEYFEKINRTNVSLDKIISNTLTQGRRRPIVIQSLFPAIRHNPPSEKDIEQYVEKLNFLKTNGAQIQLVQVYSAMRPVVDSECSHLPLRFLTQIARTVRKQTGLRAEVF